MYKLFQAIAAKLSPAFYLFTFLGLLLFFDGRLDAAAMPDIPGNVPEMSYAASHHVCAGVSERTATDENNHFKKHLHVARRKSQGQSFLHSPYLFSSAREAADELESVNLLSGVTAYFLRPSYYIFLFLYALF